MRGAHRTVNQVPDAGLLRQIGGKLALPDLTVLANIGKPTLKTP